MSHYGEYNAREKHDRTNQHPNQSMPQPYAASLQAPAPGFAPLQPLPYPTTSMPQPYPAPGFAPLQPLPYPTTSMPQPYPAPGFAPPQPLLYPTTSMPQPYPEQAFPMNTPYPAAPTPSCVNPSFNQPQYPANGAPPSQAFRPPQQAPPQQGPQCTQYMEPNQGNPQSLQHQSGLHPNIQNQSGIAAGGNYPKATYGNSGFPNSGPPAAFHVTASIKKGTPTLRPVCNFNARTDAEILRKAMNGFGTDEQAIISVIAYRSDSQRQEITRTFKTMYGKDLIENLKSELSGNFLNTVIALMIPRFVFLAREFRRAMQGVGTADHVLIEIMCTSSNHEIHEIKRNYQREFGINLESDLRSETSGNFKRLMISLSMGNRDESHHVDFARAQADAQALYAAGAGRFGTDESKFNAILVSQSFAQLKQVFAEYYKLTHTDIEKAIQDEFSGDIEKGLLAIVKCVKDRAAFFAEQLHRSMKGFGTEDKRLIRLIVTRCEIDMGDIKYAFQRMYAESLESFISVNCSGDYKKLLLALVD